MRLALLPLVVLIGTGGRAYAQAPPAGPVVLRLAPSARTQALGGAWVAGRDHDVIFYNPAQLIAARPGLDLSITRHGPSSTMGSIASTFAAGKWSLTLGWGVQVLDFSVAPGRAYPYDADIVIAEGTSNGFGALVAAGGALVVKGFRAGATAKFAMDRVSALPGFDGATSVNQGALLVDLGVARNILGGTAAASLQNLGGGAPEDGSRLAIPKQVLVGWSMTRAAGQLDLGVFGQVLMRDEWTAPAAGVEAGYSWIEGYNVVLRAGVRRPDAAGQTPFSLGGALSVDRLTVEYTAQFFDGGHTAHGVTVRWR